MADLSGDADRRPQAVTLCCLIDLRMIVRGADCSLVEIIWLGGENYNLTVALVIQWQTVISACRHFFDNGGEDYRAILFVELFFCDVSCSWHTIENVMMFR